MLHHFSELICPAVSMFSMQGEGSLDALRGSLVYSIKEATFRKVGPSFRSFTLLWWPKGVDAYWDEDQYGLYLQ